MAERQTREYLIVTRRGVNQMEATTYSEKVGDGDYCKEPSDDLGRTLLEGNRNIAERLGLGKVETRIKIN
tara:strand:- start:1646 stop:1855 length:210 start_codon:yes stop_codon:yes gene_type:complete